MLWYELTRWWAYRRIKHPKMNLYVWVLPLALAVLSTAALLALPVRPAVAGRDGVLQAVIGVLTILPGFFLAALAAVATFQRPEMDVEMPAPAPVVGVRFGDAVVETEVTRRMFLSYLFSYLTIVSLILVIVCVSANFAAPSLASMLSSIEDENVRWWAQSIGRGAVVAFVSYWCASILITTLHGIFFLTERMHQPD